MFKKFVKLVPVFNLKQDTWSLYGDIVICFFNKY